MSKQEIETRQSSYMQFLAENHELISKWPEWKREASIHGYDRRLPLSLPHGWEENLVASFLKDKIAICSVCGKQVNRVLDLHSTDADICSFECEEDYWLDILYD